MKTSATLSETEKSCRTRLKEHYPEFIGGLHSEEFVKEIEEWMASGYYEKMLEKELKEYQELEALNDICECIAIMFESQDI